MQLCSASSGQAADPSLPLRHVRYSSALRAFAASHGVPGQLTDGKRFPWEEAADFFAGAARLLFGKRRYTFWTEAAGSPGRLHRTATDHVFAATFNRFLLEHPDEARQIIEKGQLASKARVAAKRAREVTRKKSGLEISNLPGKLADNTSKDPEISELFIVEGDSAGGSAKQGRSRLTQAILPIRGKILNVEKATLDRVLANDEIRSLFTALGTGFGDDFDITKANYHKLIIMTDADVDGAHIRTLLLTLFYRFMKPMITHGYVYIAQPPLYQVRQGKFVKYIDSDEELEQVVSSLQPSPKPVIQRYKGLGEMDAEQLWETTMDPENRHLLRVKLDDAEQADKIFPMLMGTKVGPRRDFIEQNAKFVENLDL